MPESAFALIGSEYVNLAQSAYRAELFELMAYTREPALVKRNYCKVEIEYLWYILAALKVTLGEVVFNSHVKLQSWENGSSTIVWCLALTERETVAALTALKELVDRTLESNPSIGPGNIVRRETTICVCNLNTRLADVLSADVPNPLIPLWPEINSRMKLRK